MQSQMKLTKLIELRELMEPRESREPMELVDEVLDGYMEHEVT